MIRKLLAWMTKGMVITFTEKGSSVVLSDVKMLRFLELNLQFLELKGANVVDVSWEKRYCDQKVGCY